MNNQFFDSLIIEISKYYERMPKPTLLSTQEFLEDKIYHRTVTEE